MSPPPRGGAVTAPGGAVRERGEEMADQTRKPKPREDEQVEAAEETKAETQTDDVDELLDEIDEVLEANAEEFVRSYVQKGGE
jgi:ubiquitin-like protein Pup